MLLFLYKVSIVIAALRAAITTKGFNRLDDILNNDAKERIEEMEKDAKRNNGIVVENKKIHNHELNILLSIKERMLRSDNVECASDILDTITKHFYPMSILSCIADGVASYFDTARKVSVLARGKAYHSNII